MPDIHIASNGDDTTGDGSEALPYATLAEAITQATDSDRIRPRYGDKFFETDNTLNVTNVSIVPYGDSTLGSPEFLPVGPRTAP